MGFIIANNPQHFLAAQQLFKEYSAWLKVDLCFQSFATELENLATMYGPNEGGIILYEQDGFFVACGAIRKKNATTCELKRMWVQDAYKGKGIGQQILLQCIQLAKQKNYTTIVLDTLQRLQPAIALYKKHGFTETTAYYNNPHPDTVYMQLSI
jgi:GNAT superfamily N-acetyltransferase